MKGLYLIPDKENLEQSIQLLEECQGAFEYNDFFLPNTLDDKKKQLEIVESYAKLRSDFSRDTMHGAFLDVTVHSMDKKIKEISELRVRQSMDIAKEMGLRGVVFHTNRIYGFRDAAYLKNWKAANKSFFAEICKTYPNQQVYMENMFDEAPDMLRELAEEMKDYTNFGVCLDYAHAVISGTKEDCWMRELAPFIKHMHINDNDFKNDLHEALGAGQIDWQKFQKEFEDNQIDASILVEVSGKEKQRKSLEYMRRNSLWL